MMPRAVAAEIAVEAVEATVELIRVAAEGMCAVTNDWVPSGFVDALGVAGDASMSADMGLEI
jgi:hypothetical protein